MSQLNDGAMVTRLVAKYPLFSTLTPEQLSIVASRARPRDASAGQMVVREGEHGDEMFLIASGALQVFTRGFDGTDLVLARLEKGEWFGEQALLPGNSGRRNAHVRALENSRLWVLSRESLEAVLAQHEGLLAHLKETGEAQRALRGGKLRERVFEGLGMNPTASAVTVQDYAVGESVFRQGDPGDRVYLILAGRAVARRREGETDTVLSELLPGQFFGELAILRNEPRSATVEAVEALQVASVDAGWFRDSHASSPQMRTMMESLSSMYMLPRRGLLTLQAGQLDGRPCWTAVHHLPDGRRVLSTRLASGDFFTARVLGDHSGNEPVVYANAERGLRRGIQVAEDRIVALDAEGEWPRLGEVLGLLLDGEVVHDWQVELFRHTGDLSPQEQRPLYEDAEVVCACTQATCGKLRQAIADGCHTLDAIADRTSATRVCGGCTPLVKELLGQSDWTPAMVASVETLADDVKSFRLRPLGTRCLPYLPGQHVVVQARVDDRWVQRAYTLSSVPGSDHYEITVKREPRGAFSRWLFERMRPEDLLRVSSPRGEYVHPDPVDDPVVCMVGGIGVTPAIAFSRWLASHGRPTRLHVDYSVSREGQAIGIEEMRDLARADNRFSVKVRITSRQGRIELADVASLVERFPGGWFFLCGGTAYMEGVKELLLKRGVPEERIRIEVFSAAGGVPSAVAPEVPLPSTTVAAAGPVAPPATAPGQRVEVPLSRRDEAALMLREHYAELNAPTAFAGRWRQVEAEWDRTGTYFQTPQELAFAARTAWRNSIRCVGRLYWSGLAVRDMRHVTTSEGMLDAIMDHIRLATNGGNLRPLITVFPQKSADGSTPRMWSPQLFRYAGYRLSSGKILGDPANVELTEVAVTLGWSPPPNRTMFDLLPVIAQAAGESPRWREIPRDLVLEVPITHPQLEWFAGLGLKWYSLPAVSVMRLDAGGVDYHAIPFNGWYQGTEIGARNFGDVARYDLLPKVAQRMGLDMSTDRALWRDRALIELNVAVLHSYEKAGVTMMDHHASSKSFDKFEEMEKSTGRPVHAMWSWLVPPISGSAVTVYHRGDDWPTQEIKPNYFVQADPWKTDPNWKK